MQFSVFPRGKSRYALLVLVSTGTLLGVCFSVSWMQKSSRWRAPAGEPICVEGGHPSLGDRSAHIRALREVMELSLTKTSPHLSYRIASSGEGLGVFNGNYDWHSSVHGHWALLSMARLLQDTELEQRLLQRLTPQALDRVRQILNQSRLPVEVEDELPYGQSWLLLMLEELSSREVGRSSAAIALRDETEERVVSYLETHSFPELQGSFGSEFIRTHHSWLFSYLLLKMSHPTSARAERVDRLRSRIEQVRHQFEYEWAIASPGDFLHLPAVLALLDRLAPMPEMPRAFYDGALVLPPRGPIVAANAHQSGAVMVSVWPYAAQSVLGDVESCQVFSQALEAMMAHPEGWHYDAESITAFNTVGHFVPQFIWMGILLEQGAH